MTESISRLLSLEPHVLSLLADPVTKQPAAAAAFREINGVLDARVFLKNTHGFIEWADGQDEMERLYKTCEASGSGYRDRVKSCLAQIEYDRPVYEHFHMSGSILDVGGGVGTVREFLPETVQFVSIDPYINAPHEIQPANREAYSCLNLPLNFIAATAEFLPFIAESFDWLHMRSMLDHVQVPDLALCEARRVLKPDGRVMIGLYVKGGKSGVVSSKQCVKEFVRKTLGFVGIDRWKDTHVWHPTYKGLIKLIQDNGFTVEDVYWQPHWHDQVCYVCARKA
jgi:ubiquinone/menaquinone biosynthesis C-methylase UbiE